MDIFSESCQVRCVTAAAGRRLLVALAWRMRPTAASAAHKVWRVYEVISMVLVGVGSVVGLRSPDRGQGPGPAH